MAKQGKTAAVKTDPAAFIPPPGYASINKLRERIADTTAQLSAGNLTAEQVDQLTALRAKSERTLAGLLAEGQQNPPESELVATVRVRDAQIKALELQVKTLEAAVASRDEQIAVLNGLVKDKEEVKIVTPVVPTTDATEVIDPTT